MSYYVIVRGPAGVGKSDVSRRLARRLNGYYISYDKIMEVNKLDKVQGKSISEWNFKKANDLVLSAAKEKIAAGKVMVFDGCFYHKSQLNHLLKNIPYKHFIFTLRGSLEECITRDRKRKSKIGAKNVKAVYRLCSKFDAGIVVNTSGRTIKETTSEILSRLPATTASS